MENSITISIATLVAVILLVFKEGLKFARDQRNQKRNNAITGNPDSCTNQVLKITMDNGFKNIEEALKRIEEKLNELA
jgi:hypothetical protein